MRDHEAEWREWERRLAIVTAVVEQYPFVETQINQSGRSNVTPILAIRWDRGQLAISGVELARQLAAGDPRIKVFAGEDSFSVNPYMMEAGEEQIVAERLGETLAAA